MLGAPVLRSPKNISFHSLAILLTPVHVALVFARGQARGAGLLPSPVLIIFIAGPSPLVIGGQFSHCHF
jgi:hypothetical protein